MGEKRGSHKAMLKVAKTDSNPETKTIAQNFFQKLKKRRIIEILAAFIGGGWLILEFVHWILIDHYHLPERLLDVALVSLLGTLLSVLIWRWFRGEDKRRGLKPEFFLLPCIILATLFLDIFFFTRVEKKEGEVLAERKWKNSIAVLPFANISGEEEQEYFCDGVTEELINALSHIRDLKVVARTSAFSFKGKEQDIREIGRKLGVETVLEGSVRKSGNNLRITAQLVNVVDGYHLWSERYDRQLTDIFAIQDEIALAIANRLKLELLGEEKPQVVKRHTQSREAHDLYLRGRFFWNKRTPEGIQKALEYFYQALAIDPAYALAYSGIADCYSQFGWYDLLPPHEAYPKARAAVKKALEIDDSLPEAWTSLALINDDYDWSFEEAERNFRKAIELNPGYPGAHHWYSMFLAKQGRQEQAIVEIQKALEVDPFSLLLNNAAGGTYYSGRQYDLSIEAYKKTLELDKNYAPAHIFLTLSCAEKGLYDEAIASAQRGIELTGGNYPLAIAFLGYAYAKAGRKEEARQTLEKLLQINKTMYCSSSLLAVIYGELGEMDRAFLWTEKAYMEHDHWLTYLKIIPVADSIRSDPRFASLLKKIGMD